jgi:hypothetical protein
VPKGRDGLAKSPAGKGRMGPYGYGKWEVDGGPYGRDLFGHTGGLWVRAGIGSKGPPGDIDRDGHR